MKSILCAVEKLTVDVEKPSVFNCRGRGQTQGGILGSAHKFLTVVVRGELNA